MNKPKPSPTHAMRLVLLCGCLLLALLSLLLAFALSVMHLDSSASYLRASYMSGGFALAVCGISASAILSWFNKLK